MLTDKDPLFDDAVTFVKENGKANTSFLQRKLNIGYARTARILDQMEESRIIGPVKDNKPREIFISHMVEGKVKLPDPESIIEEPKVEWKMTKYMTADQSKLKLDIGEDEEKNQIDFDFEKYSNLLIVGSQFTGSVQLINNILLKSVILYHPDNLRLIVVDGNQKDLIIPNVPHLLTPLITEPEKAISALKWSWSEINRRMKMDSQKNLPKVLIVISSLNQLMMFSSREVEESIYQILVSGRKYGFYCILGTDLIPKIPKTILANIPAKIVFKPTDENLTGNNGVKGSKDLNFPDEAILETMFENQKKIKIFEINQEIYKETVMSIGN